MNKGVSRFIPMVFIGIIILLIIAAGIALVGTIFGNNKSQKVDSNTELTKISSDRKIEMKVRGKIVADENFRTYKIVISPDKRTFVRSSGYLESEILRREFSNNSKAYEEFVNALNTQNFDSLKPFEKSQDSTKGICSDGVLIEFNLIKNNESIKHLWTTSCKKFRGSLTIEPSGVQRLFLDQIPEIEKYIGKNN